MAVMVSRVTVTAVVEMVGGDVTNGKVTVGVVVGTDESGIVTATAVDAGYSCCHRTWCCCHGFSTTIAVAGPAELISKTSHAAGARSLLFKVQRQ